MGEGQGDRTDEQSMRKSKSERDRRKRLRKGVCGKGEGKGGVLGEVDKQGKGEWHQRAGLEDAGLCGVASGARRTMSRTRA